MYVHTCKEGGHSDKAKGGRASKQACYTCVLKGNMKFLNYCHFEHLFTKKCIMYLFPDFFATNPSKKNPNWLPNCWEIRTFHLQSPNLSFPVSTALALCRECACSSPCLVWTPSHFLCPPLAMFDGPVARHIPFRSSRARARAKEKAARELPRGRSYTAYIAKEQLRQGAGVHTRQGRAASPLPT